MSNASLTFFLHKNSYLASQGRLNSRRCTTYLQEFGDSIEVDLDALIQHGAGIPNLNQNDT
jgi:hypothetical protein